jgi:subfamily B ATP-binding cassette protein MsbA
MMLKENLKLFKRMMGYLVPHIPLTIVGLFLILIFTVFSSVNIFMLKPVFDGILVKSKRELIDSDKNAKPGAAKTFLKDFSKSATQDLAAALKGEKPFKAARRDISGRFNHYLKTAPISEILFFIVVFILTAVGIKCGAEYIRRLVFLSINMRIMTRVRMDVYRKVMGFSMHFFNQYKVGYLMSRIIGEVSIVQDLVVATASGIATNLIQTLFFFSVILYLDFKLTLILMVCLPPLMLLLDRLANWLKKYQQKIQEIIGHIMSVAQETLAGIRLVIVSNRQDYENRRYEKSVTDFQRSMMQISRLDYLAAPISEFITTILGLGIVVYALRTRVMNPASAMTSGDFVVYVAFMFSMMRPIKQLNTFFVNWQKGMVIAGRVYEMLDRQALIQNSPGAAPLERFEQKIEFKRAGFAYKAGMPVLSDISFTIRKGEVVAVVGPSGAGKTTLVDLLPRLYDVSGGEVCIDGKNVRDYTLESLRDKMGIVTQDTILFHDTVGRNIAYGNDAASAEEIRRAAEVANAADFIDSMPLKYDTVIGERGTRLSGGERQRVCIARAILRNPEILIFDEATSALDNESEAKVQKAIDNLIKDRTAVVIAHRLSTIKHADKIVVLDGGRIREMGSHDELIAKQGIYKRLYDMQFRDRA